MYTLTYIYPVIYTTIYQIKQFVLQSYVIIDVFLLKIPHECGGSVTLL